MGLSDWAEVVPGAASGKRLAEARVNGLLSQVRTSVGFRPPIQAHHCICMIVAMLTVIDPILPAAIRDSFGLASTLHGPPSCRSLVRTRKIASVRRTVKPEQTARQAHHSRVQSCTHTQHPQSAHHPFTTLRALLARRAISPPKRPVLDHVPIRCCAVSLFDSVSQYPNILNLLLCRVDVVNPSRRTDAARRKAGVGPAGRGNRFPGTR